MKSQKERRGCFPFTRIFYRSSLMTRQAEWHEHLSEQARARSDIDADLSNWVAARALRGQINKEQRKGCLGLIFRIFRSN